MKLRNQTAIVSIVLILLGIGPVAAQTNPTTTANSTYDGRVVAPEPSTDADNISSVADADRPERPESNDIAPDVKRRLEDFKVARDRYLAQQEVLRRQAVGATDAERVKLRRQLAQLRAEWIRRAQEMRREFAERKNELKDKLPSHRELLDELADEAQNSTFQQLRQEKLDEQRPATRPRDGVD